MKKKKILILSRKYPPSIGGMQVFARDFIRRMESVYDVDRIVLGGRQLNLVWFLPYLFAASLARLAGQKYDLVWLCDGLLAPLGALFKKITGVKVGVTVHGLDVTYSRFSYQRFVPPAIRTLDKVVCVSANTMKECLERGVSREKCVVITNGVEQEDYAVSGSTASCLGNLYGFLGDDIGGKKMLISVGRLIRRKGIDWFASTVVPLLDDDHVYLVAGDGPEKRNILNAAERSGVSGRVRLLGKVSDDHLRLLYNYGHALVLPNQRIEGDPEGFGIVAIEAASCGLPVVANSVDGVSEAVLDGRTGWLVDYNDEHMFAEKVRDPGLDRGEVRAASGAFSWEEIIKRYEKVIDGV